MANDANVADVAHENPPAEQQARDFDWMGSDFDSSAARTASETGIPEELLRLHAQMFGRSLGHAVASRNGHTAPPSTFTFSTSNGREVRGRGVSAVALAAGSLLGLAFTCATCAGFLVVVASCIGVPMAMAAFYIGAWLMWFTHFFADCDQPLETWLGIYLLYSVALTCCRPLVVRGLCRWRPRTTRDSLPLRVQFLQFLAPVFPCLWAMLGHSLVANSRTCAETSPWLRTFVSWFSWAVMMLHGLHLTWFCISVIGVRTLLWVARRGPGHSLLRFLAERGLLQNMNAARPNIIEEMEVVPFQSSFFADPADPNDTRPQGECCICLDAYDEAKQIRRTQCGHFMHHECLDIWLQVSRTCPACRSDLESLQRGDASV